MTRVLIDAREMSHPEPLEKGIDVLRALNETSYLYMLNHKNPIPLVNLAKQHGFQTLSHEDDDKQWHILIAKTEESTLREFLDV